MRCRARRRVPISEAPATSEYGDFLGMLVYTRRDSLAENRAM